MGGWHRLWMFISVLLLLVAVTFGWLFIPSESKAVLRNIESSKCKYLLKLPEGFELVGPPSFDDPCYNLLNLLWRTGQPIMSRSDYTQYVRDVRFKVVAITAGVWVGLCLLIYVIGWSVGWIIRGFRQKGL